MIVGALHIIMVNFRQTSKIRGIIISISFLVSCLMAPVSPVTAHPHMWIDLNSQVVIGNDGKAIAVYQEWLFDDFFSTALIEDAAKHSNGIQAGLTAEVNIILEGLQAYNFFTLVTVNDEIVPADGISGVDVEIRGQRVWMSFTMQIAEPVDLKTQQFSYAVFDPTYYIEMFHLDDAVVSFSGNVPDGCSATIRQPNPSSEAIALSQSTTLDDDPNQMIGRLFAETVLVKCQ